MLTEEEKQKIQRLSTEGRPVAEIAREVRRDRKTVRGVLNPHGTPHGAPQGNPVLSSCPEERGELAARVFNRLNRGEKPEFIVVAEKLAPDVVLGFHREWIVSKNQGAVLALEQELHKVLEVLPGLIKKVEALEEGLQSDPLYDIRRRFVCPYCQNQGFLAVRVKCPECHQWTHVGWSSTEDKLSILESEENIEKLFPGGPRR